MKFTTKATALFNAVIVAGALSYPAAEAYRNQREAQDDQRHCLVQNIYHEARGATIDEKVAVAWVTRNRMESSKFPASYCEVVYQRAQFSWTLIDPRTLLINETKRIVEARAIADAVMEGSIPDPTGGALYFYAHGAMEPPHWTRYAYNVRIFDALTFMQIGEGS